MSDNLRYPQRSLWKVKLGKGDIHCAASGFLHWCLLCVGIPRKGNIVTAALRSGSQVHVHGRKLKAAQTSSILASPVCPTLNNQRHFSEELVFKFDYKRRLRENTVSFRNKDMAAESCPVPIVGGLQLQEEMWMEQMSWYSSSQ